MDINIATIEKFYTAFSQKDWASMNSCYTADITFSDPVFGLLQGIETKAMWQMLCSNAKDFSLTFGNIQTTDGEYYTCDWVATYRFSATNRKVVNVCKAYMRLKDGVIEEHSDGFSFYKWARQALGIPGLLFGWTSFLHKKVGQKARKNLTQFMEEHKMAESE